MTPYLQDPDVTLWHGDALATLRGLPDESVDCVVTSPPYWGLRDYGTGAWEGGDADCSHETVPARNGRGGSGASGKQTVGAFPSEFAADVCGKCGATRTDQQLGLEPTPDQYIARMVGVFREVRRVLAKHGTCWVNLGDSYATTPPGRNPDTLHRSSGLHGIESQKYRDTLSAGTNQKRNTIVGGLKPKDLCGIPWRVAFALQADGWWLRSDIIWSKPNPMPESVTDRPTKAHEYVFLLTKQPRYFFDQEAVRETATWDRWGDQTNPKYIEQDGMHAARMKPRTREELQARAAIGRNVRSVWEIATQPFPQAHFATFPEELVRRCVLAGTSERGKCPECGKPWVRATSVSYEKSPVHGAGSVVGRHYETGANNFDGAGLPRLNKVTATVGWIPTCACYDELYHRDFPKPRGRWQQITWFSRVRQRPIPKRFGWPVEPCVVADIFAGSGTTLLDARKHGRHSIGIELNEGYCAMAANRLSQLSLLAEGAPT